MTVRMKSAYVVACAAALTLLMAIGIACPRAAWAEEAVYTATTVPTYQNPFTGVIEDSGGSSNQALGESMVTGTTYANALVETDAAGNTFVTLRFSLIDQISGMQFSYSDEGSTFYLSESTEMQRDTANNTADYRFQVPSASTTIRVDMDVVPMGRTVIFFVRLTNLQPGNADTFVQTVDTSVAAAATAETTAESTVVQDEGTDDVESAEIVEDESSAAVDDDAELAETSSSAGVQEFNADGVEVTDGNESEPLDGTTIALVLGVAALIAVLAGVAVYAGYVRPKRARQAAAAAAASAKPTDGAQADGDAERAGKDDERA